MGKVVETTCDGCLTLLKKETLGGKQSDSRTLLATYPRERYTVTNNRGETFDYCSRDCLELGNWETGQGGPRGR